jgi:hypothetical protein
VKRRRELEAEKYFKQQILLDSETAENKLIRKTHKGLEPVQDDFDGCLFPNTSSKLTCCHFSILLKKVSC